MTNAQEVFVPNSKGGIESLTKAVVSGNKTSGKAILSVYGAKLTTSLVLDGKYANTILPKTSTVFYVFTPKNISIQAWKMAPLKSKKKNRELPFMKTSAYSGSKTNIDEIPLMNTKITDEIYELRPMGDLNNGDYAIILVDNGVPVAVYDFRVENNLPPYPQVSHDALKAEFYPSDVSASSSDSDMSSNIIRWYFDSDPRGARIFYRIISNVPQQVKNTNESYMTTTPLEETKALNIPGLTYENSNDVVIEIKLTKRGYEDQVKRYNVRQALDQQEISGFFELVEK
ncbi:MAG: hypothetical protein K2I89_06355 [Muribaculaceae bacterium]|nr:hypothetical protein [Muribaculaceae bacterium]